MDSARDLALAIPGDISKVPSMALGCFNGKTIGKPEENGGLMGFNGV